LTTHRRSKSALGAALEKQHPDQWHTQACRRPQKLKIHQHFEDVFDITAADLDPKPLAQVYQRCTPSVDAARQQCSDLAQPETPHALE
jgi:hypothetical protein